MAADGCVESRSKDWCFTSSDVEKEPLSAYAGTYDYLVYHKETCPDTGLTRLRGFVSFKTRTKLSTVRNRLGSANVERMQGTRREAAEHCKKDEDSIERGKLPIVLGSRDRFKHAMALAESGRMDEIKQLYPGLYIRYKNTLQELVRFDTTQLSSACGVWLAGPPRSGKDHAVREFCKGDLYVKSLSKWWDGYKGERNVLISDVNPNQEWIGDFLKIWCDRYPFNAEIKHSFIFIRPQTIYVTSNYAMEDCFEDGIRASLQARFDVYALRDGLMTLEKHKDKPASVLFSNASKKVGESVFATSSLEEAARAEDEADFSKDLPGTSNND